MSPFPSLLWAVALAGPVTTADLGQIQTRLAEVGPLRAVRLADGAPAVPDSAWAKAASGAVATGVQSVAGQKAKKGWGVAVLDVPIDRLWAGLNDELRHRDLLGLGHVEITRGRPCEDQRRVMMLLPLPVVSDRWWVAENHYNVALARQTGGRVRELEWVSVDNPAAEPLSEAARAAVSDAVPVLFNTGAWLLIDLDGQRTLAEYHAWSDPGGSVPAGAASSFANASIADTIEKLARYAVDHTPTCLGR